ncbi:MAG: cupin domain-containing protein [Candidatus Bathyarchaeia archaeon]
MSTEPVVVKYAAIKFFYPPGGGKAKRMLTPETCGSTHFYGGFAFSEPGKTLHRWHRHTYDRGESYEVEFPPDFEEAYFIVEGEGTLQWKIYDQIKECKVEKGDAIFFPKGCCEHQLLNTGKNTLTAVFVGAPPKIKIMK